jgi:hypothetical protein
MQSIWRLALGLAALPHLFAIGSDRLLPTGELSKQTAQLIAQGANTLPNEPEHQRLVAAIEAKISHFVLRQLKATPPLSSVELEHQLRSILNTNTIDTNGSWNDKLCGAPQAFIEERQVVLTYVLWPGIGATSTIIESYSIEDGQAHLGARKTSMASYDTASEILATYSNPDEHWMVVWGRLVGWSGLAPAGRAVLYRIGANSINVVWQKSGLPYMSVHVHRGEGNWELSYTDALRYRDNKGDHQVLDVYHLDYAPRTFRQILHLHY